MEKILKIGEAAKMLGVQVHTLQVWDKAGKLKAHRTPTNQRFYYESEIRKVIGLPTELPIKRINVAYARVSSHGQKNDLARQLEYIKNFAQGNQIPLDREITDIGSGLNYKRSKWNNLLEDVENKKIANIYITYRDRFVRFGFDWFERFCKRHGTNIVVLNDVDTSPDKELVSDLTSIIHVFSCRLYGLRRYEKKIENDKHLKGDENKNDKDSD